MRDWLLALLLAVAVAITSCLANDEDHVYRRADAVTIWMNKVGPYHNPMETYSFFSLPFCQGNPLEPHRHAIGLGEVLEGNELINSNMKLSFREDVSKTALCSQYLRQNDVDVFVSAVKNHYWYQMYIDELPVWGLLGKCFGCILQSYPDCNDPQISPKIIDEDDRKFKEFAKFPTNTAILYTHKRFTISYNGPHIIHVNLSYTDEYVPLVDGSNFSFTYEAKWVKTEVDFDDRFDRYLEEDFFEHQIHWFSIFNSFMMVMFLCGLVALILMRTLRNDYAKYTRDDDGIDSVDKGIHEDSGWKQVHGDVFRRPENLGLLAAVLGTGAQLVVLVLFVILFAIGGSLYVEPGAITRATIACYSVSTIVAGYVSGGFYNRYYYPRIAEGWIQTMLLTVGLLPGTFFSVIFVINWVGVYYGTTYAIPFGSIVKIMLLWVFVSLPLAVLGTVFGRHWNGKPDFPCRVGRLAHHIPEGSWYTDTRFIVLVTGILPFGSIFIEMYFVFTSFWNYKFYYVYGFMLLVFIILSIVTICVTVVAVYFLLNAENWRWQWTAFCAAGSTAFYVFLYSIYFYFFKTRMYGFLQVAYYFGYMSLFCFALAIMCGSIGYFGSEMFVKRIYRNIKCE